MSARKAPCTQTPPFWLRLDEDLLSGDVTAQDTGLCKEPSQSQRASIMRWPDASIQICTNIQLAQNAQLAQNPRAWTGTGARY